VRAIAFNTVTSRVPSPSERGSFMSLQSTIQHFASACGAFASSKLLSSNADGKLVGIEKVAAISMALTLLVPVLIAVLERRVDGRKLVPVGGPAQA
jgi:predicted MFS family arabinose efflux permease